MEVSRLILIFGLAAVLVRVRALTIQTGPTCRLAQGLIAAVPGG